MSSPQMQPRLRPSSGTGLHGDFRVEVLGSQEPLDLDCGKFYTEYILRCSWIERNGTPEVCHIWDVVRRYREFCAVDILLREKYPSRAPMFPYLPSKKYIGSSLSSKKYIGSSLSADFVDKRQRDLGYYMMSILHSCPLLVQEEVIDSFLDIKWHILERAREEMNDGHAVSTPKSSNGGVSPIRVQL